MENNMSNSKSNTRKTAIKDETKIVKKKATCGVSESWDDVLNCLPKKATTFKALCDAVAKKFEGYDASYTRRVIGSLRRRGCVAVAKS